MWQGIERLTPVWGLVATALVTALDLHVTRQQDALAVVVLAGSTPAKVMMAQVVTVLRRVTPPVTRPRTRVVLRLLLVPGQNLTLLQFAETHRALGPSDVGYPLASNLQDHDEGRWAEGAPASQEIRKGKKTVRHWRSVSPLIP